MSIGQMIKDRRKYLRMTQKYLADKLCVTQQTVCKWESGKAKPDTWMLYDLSSALGYTVTEMLEEKLSAVNNICHVYNRDTGDMFGFVNKEDARDWMKKTSKTHVVKMISIYNIQYWSPRENEKPHVIMP